MPKPEPPSQSHTARLRALAGAAGLPLAGAMVRVLAGPLRQQHTLLAVCPNSEAVTRAALRVAQEAGMPLLYAATLNQVDTDGGYTGWTPAALARFVDAEAEHLALDVPVVLCLDHGGPWKKDRHALDDLSYDATMAAVETSIAACLDAGYGLLHLDPTVDRRLPAGTPVPVATIVERTVALLQHAEAHRQQRGLAPVAYEVGTEEVGGGLGSAGRFEAFLEELTRTLTERGLPAPCFVVGDVGTSLATGHFDVAQARRLTAIARRHGALVKGHYTDGVDHPELYPPSGIGGANVGPGFAGEEYDALMELVALERRLGQDSQFRETLQAAVLTSGRWKKWCRPDEAKRPFDQLAPDRQTWLVATGSRYVWTNPEVRAARARLYAHVRPHRDADAFVLRRIRQAMLRYVHAFNLVGFSRRLEDVLARR